MADQRIGLTPRASDALKLAGKAKDRLGHAAIGPEHVLLGILAEGTGLGTGVLAQIGVDLAALRVAVEKAVEPAAEGEKTSFGVLSAAAKEVLTSSQDEAKRLNHSWIGQEHILLALLAQPGPVAQVLSTFGVNVENVRAQVGWLVGPMEPLREELKRYNLALPEGMFRQVVALAEREHTTVLEVLRRSVKLGLLVAEAQEAGAKFVIRDGTGEREIVIL